ARERGHAVGVDDEQHVVTRRRRHRILGRLDVQPTAALRKGEAEVSLVLIESVSDRSQPDERHLRNIERVHGLHKKLGAVLNPRRDGGDGRARASEEIGWGVDLTIRLAITSCEYLPSGRKDPT